MVGNSPWALSGDFNVCLKVDEKLGGNVGWTLSMSDFKDCVMRLGLSDLRYSGQLFTWWGCNISTPKHRKLDRVLVNAAWHNAFPLAASKFLCRGMSDHCPATTSLGLDHPIHRKPFQYFSFLSGHQDFLPSIAAIWSLPILGDPWFVLTSKLKKVKRGPKGVKS